MSKKSAPRVPRSNVPIIGASKDEVIKNAIDEALTTLTQHLDPILHNLGGAIEELQKRLAIVEEVRSLLPPKIEVVIKHEDKTVEILPGIAQGVDGDEMELAGEVIKKEKK